MQSLVFLIALVALSQAAVDPDTVNACVAEGLAMKTCVFQTANETFHKNLAELKDAKLKEAVMGCFDQAGISGICSMPTPPPNAGKFPMGPGGFQMGPGGGFPMGPGGPQMGPGGFQMPTPSPDTQTCFNGAKGKLMGCINKELGLPEDFKPKGMDAHPQGRPPMPPMGHLPPFPHDVKKMQEFIGKICGGNTDAAKALGKCAMDKIAPHMRALAGIVNPMVIACQAGAACHEKNKLSAGCMDIMKQGSAAFCKCREEPATFIKGDATCDSTRAAFKDHQIADVSAHNVEHVASAQHDIPEHSHMAMPMDFCNPKVEGSDAAKKNPMEMCKNILGHLNGTPMPH